MRESKAHVGKLLREHTALLVVDVQEKLIPLEDRSVEVLQTIQKIIKGFQILNLPIVVTEQYPEGLGSTVPGLKCLLGEKQRYLQKSAFSCLGDLSIKEELQKMNIKQWVLVGIEAHVCVLQTARDLLDSGYDVVVLNDAITSRSVYDFATAIADMRDYGIRVSSTETVLFELLTTSLAPEFKKISQLIK
jgi:nicotinamidase-related amidase